MELLNSIRKGTVLFFLFIVFTLSSPLYPESAKFLSLKTRARYQRAIEQVYWQHRTWPQQNVQPKPPLDQVMPDSIIQEKLENYMKQSNALEKYWHHAIKPEHLQAEINRMIKETKNSAVLQELFATLDNDPYVIAECLARPLLVERLIRNWYAFDPTFHGALQSKAQAELDTLGLEGLKQMQGHYFETVFAKKLSNQNQQEGVIELNDSEWFDLIKNLKHQMNHLQEDENRFYFVAILQKENERIRLATVEWKKVPFFEWWNITKKGLSTTIQTAPYDFDVSAFSGNSCPDNTWTPTPAPPIARTAHTAVWTGSEMIIWGGYTGTYLKVGARYDPATDTWTPTDIATAPEPRWFHTAIWTGTEMIVWGGSAEAGVYYNTGGRYDPTSDTWTPTETSNAPQARGRHTAVWTGSEMIVWGGFNDSGNFNTGGRYSPSSNSWNATDTTNAPIARTNHTAIWTGSEMIIWGGTDDTFAPQNTGGRYNPSTDSWALTETTTAPDGRFLHTAIWTGAEMIIWGGFNSLIGGNLNTGGRYDPVANSWNSTDTATAPTARTGHSAIWIGNEMIVWGGSNATNTGSRYDPAMNNWIPTDTTTAPEGRSGHTALWTGSEMIVWGGSGNGGNAINTGGRYDPNTDFWVATDSTSAPDARSDHTAIWTGSEMIIWGGLNVSGFLNSGSRYDPSANNWTPTEIATAPEPRYLHTAIWTGSEMIIWGGESTTTFFNTGGQYNPSTNSWIATDTTTAPSGRRTHTAIWTGSEMIVWGGYGFGNFSNTGARYNPSLDIWVPTNTVNAPAERNFHTAIWTGTEMIIWGGYSGNTGHYNTGGRYDPATDSWVQTNTTAAPTARRQHTAIWNGNNMVIWGGYDGTWFNTGGRYDPVSDSWLAVDTTTAPEARNYHTAIWTGAEMIIWGGEGVNFSILNSGSRYDHILDIWNAIDVTSAPETRYLHTAIWTGNEMIIWGGLNFGTLNTGGLYDVPITLSPHTLPNGTPGMNYSVTISAMSGTPPFVFNVSSGALPDGLTLDSSTGEIAGIPTTEGTFNFTIQVTDSLSCIASRAYVVIIGCPTITLNPSVLPNGTINDPYNVTISAIGGTAPYVFSVSAGSLPDGLSLDVNSGVISGTPTTVGNFSFTITATDLDGCTGTQDYAIVINAACLYCDNFDVLPNWNFIKPTWSILTSQLQGIPIGKKAVAVATPVFAGCQICYEESSITTAGGSLNRIWMFGWYLDKNNTMELLLKQESNKIILKQRVNRKIVRKGKAIVSITPSSPNTYRVRFDGTQFVVSFDGNDVLTLAPLGGVPSGTIGFQVKNTTGSFDYIAVNP